MDSLSAHGLRALIRAVAPRLPDRDDGGWRHAGICPVRPRRRGVPRLGSATRRAAPANCSNRRSGMASIRSGEVTVNIIRAEMGQHVGTALARIVADELEADWGKVQIITVDSDPKWGLMVTGGSWSVWQSFPVLSRAGAAGRIALIEEGAKLLGVSPQSCTARNGAVHAKEDRSLMAISWRAAICGAPTRPSS